MRDLNHQLIQLCRTNRDGTYQTQHARARRRVLTPVHRPRALPQGQVLACYVGMSVVRLSTAA